MMTPSPEEFELEPDMRSLEDMRKEELQESYNIVGAARSKRGFRSQSGWVGMLAHDSGFLR
jgi:hypothetical protein